MNECNIPPTNYEFKPDLSKSFSYLGTANTARVDTTIATVKTTVGLTNRASRMRLNPILPARSETEQMERMRAAEVAETPICENTNQDSVEKRLVYF
jgi:hypothetical protein